MYTPAAFAMQNTDEMIQFIRQNNFGILFSHVNRHPNATHLPFVIRQIAPEKFVLLGHLAKANPHWKALHETEVLAVFQGPHAYISPSWYAESQAVPTWNYVAVHATGTCHIIQDAQLLHELLKETVRFHEPNSTLLDHMDEAFYVKMEQAVIGLEIEITSMEGTAKLSQNKSTDTIRGVVEGLRASPDKLAHDVAELMQRNLETLEKRT